MRDEDVGNFWCPSPFPKKGNGPYIITHGFGYSIFEHREDGIHSEMSVFVDKDHPVKFIVLKVKNESERLNVNSQQWDFLKSSLVMYDPKPTCMYSPNRIKTPAPCCYATGTIQRFRNVSVILKWKAVTILVTRPTVRNLLEETGILHNPQALYRKRLSGRTGAAMDPCAALHVKFDLLSGGEKEIIFQIGNEKNIQCSESLYYKNLVIGILFFNLCKM